VSDSEEDTSACCQQDQMHHLSVEPEHLQNGFCKTDLWHDLQINGLKKNGQCNLPKGNGMVSNGHIKNGQCLVANGSDHLVKNGFEKNGHWKVIDYDVTKNGYNVNGQYLTVKRRKDNAASKGGSSFIKENNIIEDEQYSEQSTSQSQMSHVAEHAQLNHIKVSFYKLVSGY